MGEHTPGPLYRVPVPERLRRVATRLQRRIYHRLVDDYANAGIDLCDIVHLRKDLNLNSLDFKVIFGDCGLTGPLITAVLGAEDSIIGIEQRRAVLAKAKE